MSDEEQHRTIGKAVTDRNANRDARVTASERVRQIADELREIADAMRHSPERAIARLANLKVAFPFINHQALFDLVDEEEKRLRDRERELEQRLKDLQLGL